MAFKVGDWVALKEQGAAAAGACGSIVFDYGNKRFDVEITTSPPPGCAPLPSQITAFYVPEFKLKKAGCPK